MKIVLRDNDIQTALLEYVDRKFPGHVAKIDNAYELPYEVTLLVDEEPLVVAPPVQPLYSTEV